MRGIGLPGDEDSPLGDALDDLAARAVRLGAGVLPGLLSALRLQLLLAPAFLSLPIFYGLARLMPAARTESI